MSEKNRATQLDNIGVTAAITAAVSAPTGGGNGGDLSELVRIFKERYEEDQAEKRARVEKERQEAEHKRRSREMNLAALRQKDEEIAITQAGCQHRTPAPYNQTELRGWKLVSGKTHLVCQQCGKLFSTPEELALVNSKGLYPLQVGDAPTV